MAGLTFDSAGNLYGTTWQGGTGNNYCGTGGCGTVFQLTPAGKGVWNETLLYSFQGQKHGGFTTAGVVVDAAGNVYGTAYNDGAHNWGVVFELAKVNGTWTERVLHAFNLTPDGASPLAGLTMDASGNLYGTAAQGGVNGHGTVFELSPAVGDNWNFKTLYSFRGGNDGFYPNAPLVFDEAGNLYGTTPYGGGNGCYSNLGCGTVFKLTPKAAGGWHETLLYRFKGEHDGGAPASGVVLDTVGNLYGTASRAGVYNQGVAFELMHTDGGRWGEKVIRAFQYSSPDGGLVFDSAGNLYGTTSRGFIYELMISGGRWTETVLYQCEKQHGEVPQGSLSFDSSGNLYGVTEYGGKYGFGGVFRLRP